MKRETLKRWAVRLLVAIGCLIAFFFLVLLPVGASFLITNSSGRFHYRERGPTDPAALGFAVTNVEFTSNDGIPLKGWWSPGDPSKPVIIFIHGLNRSRLELLERAADANKRGFGVLLFDLRNHGESGRAYTTIGVFESRDVCAASNFLRGQSGARPQILWGVSMGASSGILAARQCPGFQAIIADSSFLSFRETIAHHLNLFFRLPSFPIANLIVAITEIRTGLNPDDGDVEAAVRQINIPILFIAGGKDRRMPPELASRMLRASPNPMKQLLLVPEATHGEAFKTDRETYLNSVYRFLETLGYNSGSLYRPGGS
jgi:pimeloyl-ACP methyl ester carboxylesterase